jgi:hypothetical protein
MLRDGGTALGSGAYDLREVVSLSLDEIIELHGYIKAESKKDDFDSEKVRKNCGDLVTKIMNLYEAGRLSEVYNSFKPLVKYLEKNYGAESEIKKCWKEEKKIDFNDFFQGVDNDTQKCLFDFISKIKSEANPFSTSDDNGVYRIGFKQVEKENLQECIDTVRFFCGFWLEMFCADVCEKILKGLRQKNNQSKNVGHERYELISNLRFKPAGGQENFEIDVLVRNGYMLTGISCSASGKKDCKLKGFEVIQRVRQLGGDESGAILFTLLSRLETKKLKDDLAFESQRGNKILVLGSKDMKKEVLEEKIKDFITG